MRTAVGAEEAEPSRPEDLAGRVAGDAATTHAQRGLRLAELILSESRRAGQGPGSRLPTERQLAADLGVTRSSVRHALAMLEAQGRISREVGRGTFLRDLPRPGGLPQAARGGWPGPGNRIGQAADPAAGQARHLPPAGDLGSAGHLPRTGDLASVADLAPAALAPAADFAPADVMTIRRLLEPPAMSLVVAWATAADLEEMDRCLAGGDRAASYEEFESWDLALHRCIMAASHSPLLAALYQAIEGARHGHVWGDLKRRSASREHREQYQGDHRAIVGALRARDSARAVEAMRLHLARVSDHLNATDPAAGVIWR
ncbi:MAG TPA: FCD domain-containing protein [Streptosporangiaceae bacterium]|jgi:DNA-binding FadR family transcriptional regulator|nr:FCD domain-containing protein [Streptosporangiaceae bacterium]